MIKNEFRFEYMIETLSDGTQFLHCLSYQNNCLIDDSNLGKVVDIMKENKQLNDNWNKLKNGLIGALSIIKEDCDSTTQIVKDTTIGFLQNMKMIEEGNNEKNIIKD